MLYVFILSLIIIVMILITSIFLSNCQMNDTSEALNVIRRKQNNENIINGGDFFKENANCDDISQQNSIEKAPNKLIGNSKTLKIFTGCMFMVCLLIYSFVLYLVYLDLKPFDVAFKHNLSCDKSSYCTYNQYTILGKNIENVKFHISEVKNYHVEAHKSNVGSILLSLMSRPINSNKFFIYYWTEYSIYLDLQENINQHIDLRCNKLYQYLITYKIYYEYRDTYKNDKHMINKLSNKYKDANKLYEDGFNISGFDSFLNVRLLFLIIDLLIFIIFIGIAYFYLFKKK